MSTLLIEVIVSLHHVRPLLSLLEHLTIDFPSHFILSIIDVFSDTATHDKLIFLSAIIWILCHFSIPFPSSNHFSIMCAIHVTTVKHNEAQFRSRQLDSATPPSYSALSQSVSSTSAPSSSTSDVSLGNIMAQCSAWMLALIHSLQSCIR